MYLTNLRKVAIYVMDTTGPIDSASRRYCCVMWLELRNARQILASLQNRI